MDHIRRLIDCEERVEVNEKEIRWTLTKFAGSTEQQLQINLTLSVSLSLFRARLLPIK